jgi:hypothetical protein
VVGGGLPAKIWKSVATYAVNRDAPKAAEPEGDDAVSAAEDPSLVGPDGLPINGAIPLEGQPAQPIDPNAPPAPAGPSPAAPPPPVIGVPAAPAPAPVAPTSDRPAG